MSTRCGIIGLPNVGKSTLFNALSAARAEVAPYPFTTIDPNVGIVPVPDDRLAALAALLKPPKVTPASIEFVDIAGLIKGASQGEGLGNQFLGHIRDVDLLVHVVRAFEAGDVPHGPGSLDPVRDLEIVETELLLADLEVLSRARIKADKQAKGGDKQFVALAALFSRVYEALDRGEKARTLKLTPPEARMLRETPLLTSKPVILVANVSETEWRERRILPPLEAASALRGAPLIAVMADVEAELAALPPADQKEFMAAYGLTESGLARLVRESHRLLHLITFYTIVGPEVRAWTVPAGTPAVRCAGKIHSDMEKGFIRVEVMPSADLLRLGSAARVKEAGLLHIEGRDYPVQDGEVLLFRFQPA